MVENTNNQAPTSGGQTKVTEEGSSNANADDIDDDDNFLDDLESSFRLSKKRYSNEADGPIQQNGGHRGF